MADIKYYGLESHFNENVTFNKDVNINGNLNYDSLTVRNLTVRERATLFDSLLVGTGASISSPATNVLTLGTNNVERVRIDSSGNVGINSTIPKSKLDVGGTIFAGRNDSSSEGGEIAFCKSLDNSSAWSVDVYGSTSTPSLRFIDNTAGASRMEIDGSGRVTMPYQPAFQTVGTNYSQSSLAYSIIIPNVVSHNQGNHYNGSTGRFTAPVAGRYLFGFWGLSYPHNTEVNQIRAFVNGNSSGQEVQFGGAAHLHINHSGNILLNLSANDIFDFRYFQASGSAKAYSSQWNMWGYLIG